MRHDPASAAIVIMLRELKMHGMAHAVARHAAARSATRRVSHHGYGITHAPTARRVWRGVGGTPATRRMHWCHTIWRR